MRFPSVVFVFAVIISAGCAARYVPRTNPAPPLPVVSFTEVPDSGMAHATVTVCWRVDGNGTIPETGVRTDTTKPETTALRGQTHYPGNSSKPAPVGLPNGFCTAVELPSAGALYLSAYAYLDSNKSGAQTGIRMISVR